jgi:hypothetical protein
MAVAVASMPSLGSAAGLLSMLEEDQVPLQTAGLKSLLKVVDTHWSEVASSISVIEAMYEDEFFAQRELAALLASKVRHVTRDPARVRSVVQGRGLADVLGLIYEFMNSF